MIIQVNLDLYTTVVQNSTTGSVDNIMSPYAMTKEHKQQLIEKIYNELHESNTILARKL